ncbi:MAG: hypothetical protein AAF512_23740, partial [Pseudomonadota bacterium]
MKIFLIFTLTCLAALAYSTSWAELRRAIDLQTIADSEEPFNRRINSYDFDVATDGTVHIIYSKPVPNEERAQIFYTSKQVGGAMPAEASHTLLEENAVRASISTWINYDANQNRVHMSYIVRRAFVTSGDASNFEHSSGLVYQTIEPGSTTPGAKINVAPGEFHTHMEINENGQAIFAREFEIFFDENDMLRTAPFPRALRILIPREGETNVWTDREHIMGATQLPAGLPAPNLPVAEYYRLADFLYDQNSKTYHILYGNKNAVMLEAAYPTTNPPKTDGAVPFPVGVGHQLIHAMSTDLTTWTTSTVDSSGNISENEFWVDLALDPNGTPYSTAYIYATDAQGIHQGTSNVIGKLMDGQWQMQTVAGATTGASPHRVGSAQQLLFDSAGGLHAVWDNSPDAPIDGVNPAPPPGETPGGTIMYRYSPDGLNWMTRQLLLPFSSEGYCRIKFHNNRLLLMVLGDARDVRIVFAEFDVPAPDTTLLEVSTDKMFYGAGENIAFQARLQSGTTTPGDIYIVAYGPQDEQVGAFGANNQQEVTGVLVPTASAQFYYLGPDLLWQSFTDFTAVQPVVSSFPVTG